MKKKTVYVYRDEVYNSEDDVSDAICEFIEEAYPEILHSDFYCEESGEFEDEWEEVEEMEIDVQE